MAQESQDRIGRFDQVQLLTIKNVSYIHTDIKNPSTEGYWTVVGVIGNDLLLHKGSIVIRIPAVDVLKKVDYDDVISDFYSKLGNLADVKRQENADNGHTW